MTVLPTALFDAAGVRALDRSAIDNHGTPGLLLMRRAGEAVWTAVERRWPRAETMIVVCGGGNNAGDGYVIAQVAAAEGISARVMQIGDTDRLSADAKQCLNDLQGAGIELEAFSEAALSEPDIVIDAIFGTGLDRNVGGEYAEAIAALNTAQCPVVSVDIPSGINASTGAVMGDAVHATATVTFIGLKQGLLTGAAADYVGEIVFDALGVPAEIYQEVPATAERLVLEDLKLHLPARRRTAHKGHCGHVLVVGGAPGFAGAVRMAGEAAARIGAGLISIATHPAHAASVASACPELMCHAVTEAVALGPLLARATVVALGPGLGTDDWGQRLMSHVLESELPLVLDADGLNQLAADPVTRSSWVLTPHPGEAARLLHTEVAAIQQDRFAAVERLQQQFGGSCILKGPGTLIAGNDGRPPAICHAGNPGMASGGMGDVLTGVVAGLMAQSLSAAAAARLGVCLHAQAADLAAAGGERGLLATDLMPYLRQLVN